MLLNGGDPMRIAMIGSGNVGRALAQALERAGHRIQFGTRKPATHASANETTIADAVNAAEVAILAIPSDAAAEVVAAADGFSEKILIDATNPLGLSDGRLALTMGFSGSGGEQIAALAPRAKVFKTFNQTGFENMADVRPYAVRPSMFVAGDDAGAKPLVLGLVADAGFEAIDIGGLREARLLEPLAMLWIELARMRGMGSDFAFTLQRKAVA